MNSSNYCCIKQNNSYLNNNKNINNNQNNIYYSNYIQNNYIPTNLVCPSKIKKNKSQNNFLIKKNYYGNIQNMNKNNNIRNINLGK